MMNPSSEKGIAVEKSNELVVPTGYKFLPWPNQLIQTFLLPKLLGKPIGSGEILEDINVYQFDPEKLPFHRFKHCQKNQAYFFVPENKIPQGRTTPSGHWEVDVLYENLPIHREWIPSSGQWKGDIIGSRTIFTFFRGGIKTKWMMIEYKCNPCPDVEQKYVICKIEQEQDSQSSSSDDE